MMAAPSVSESLTNSPIPPQPPQASSLSMAAGMFLSVVNQLFGRDFPHRSGHDPWLGLRPGLSSPESQGTPRVEAELWPALAGQLTLFLEPVSPLMSRLWHILPDVLLSFLLSVQSISQICGHIWMSSKFMLFQTGSWRLPVKSWLKHPHPDLNVPRQLDGRSAGAGPSRASAVLQFSLDNGMVIAGRRGIKGIKW